MKIGIIGAGEIGSYVAEHLNNKGYGPLVSLVRPSRVENAIETGPGRVSRVEELPQDLTLMVDCAGHAALREHGAAILERGIDLITVSVGALADPALESRLVDAAKAGKSQLHLASGAIGALDCLRAAKVGGLDSVSYIGRKPPQGWRGSPAEQRIDLDTLTSATMHFEGTARQAAQEYPKNANVAAAVALAGIGFDKTQVELLADPTISSNIHQIRAAGSFGSFSFEIDGKALPGNPRSSALAAMSAVAAVERQRACITI